jgi:hypothetical protein
VSLLLLLLLLLRQVLLLRLSGWLRAAPESCACALQRGLGRQGEAQQQQRIAGSLVHICMAAGSHASERW